MLRLLLGCKGEEQGGLGIGALSDVERELVAHICCLNFGLLSGPPFTEKEGSGVGGGNNPSFAFHLSVMPSTRRCLGHHSSFRLACKIYGLTIFGEGTKAMYACRSASELRASLDRAVRSKASLEAAVKALSRTQQQEGSLGSGAGHCTCPRRCKPVAGQWIHREATPHNSARTDFGLSLSESRAGLLCWCSPYCAEARLS